MATSRIRKPNPKRMTRIITEHGPAEMKVIKELARRRHLSHGEAVKRSILNRLAIELR